MFNEVTKKLLTNLRPKLMLAESADEINNIITNAGGEISTEDAEQIWNEIKLAKESLGQGIDDDEMDAVAGGADKDGICWICDKGYDEV